MANSDVIEYLKLLEIDNRADTRQTKTKMLPNALAVYNRRLEEARKNLEDQGYNLSGLNKSLAAAGENSSKVSKLYIDLAKNIDKNVKMSGRDNLSTRAQEETNALYNEIKKLGGSPDSVVGQFSMPAEQREFIKFGGPQSAAEAMDSRIGEATAPAEKAPAASTPASSEPAPASSPATAGAQRSSMERQAVVPAKEAPAEAAEAAKAEPADMMKLLRGEKITLDEPAAEPAPATDMADLYSGKPIVVVADDGPAFSPPEAPESIDMDRASALFKNTHGGSFDPKSSVDAKKMEAIQNLMRDKSTEKLTPNQFSLQLYRQSK